MAEIRKRSKPLTVNPLKTSQSMGASLALHPFALTATVTDTALPKGGQFHG